MIEFLRHGEHDRNAVTLAAWLGADHAVDLIRTSKQPITRRRFINALLNESDGLGLDQVVQLLRLWEQFSDG